jgi:hypothetical protein
MKDCFFPFLLLLFSSTFSGCVARSSHTDRISQQVASNAQVTSELAKSHATLATLTAPEMAPQAATLSGYAQMQYQQSQELANQKSELFSPSSVIGFAAKAATGNWLEIGAGLLALAGGGLAARERMRANREHKLAEVCAELPPDEAVKLLRKT